MLHTLVGFHVGPDEVDCVRARAASHTQPFDIGRVAYRIHPDFGRWDAGSRDEALNLSQERFAQCSHAVKLIAL